MYCQNCGAWNDDNAVVCVKCGCATRPVQQQPQPQPQYQQYQSDKSDKNWLVTLLLCIFLGELGVHSFYAGKPVAGIIQLLTLGACGIWTFVDFIMIIVGSYKDGDGRPIKN